MGRYVEKLYIQNGLLDKTVPVDTFQFDHTGVEIEDVFRFLSASSFSERF